MLLLMLPPRNSVIPMMQGYSPVEEWQMLSEAPSFVTFSHTGRFHKAHQKRATLSMMESTTVIALEEGTRFTTS